MMAQQAFTLVNQQNGNLAFKLLVFDNNSYFDHLQRLNYYSLIWVHSGQGIARADFSEYSFAPHALFAFTPYQPFMLQSEEQLTGIALHFHPDFFCIHKHQAEVACNGILFNNVYAPPFVTVDATAAATFHTLIDQMKTEMQNPALAQYELLVAYLKILLITASRLKQQQQPALLHDNAAAAPFVLQHLKNFIEQHFKTHHAPADYAAMLHISPKALAKLTKRHFNKTLGNLIAERIVIEAKRELYLTNKTVKEIAYALGYEDEFYFSRFFKNNADVSPQLYRETVGFARAMAV